MYNYILTNQDFTYREYFEEKPSIEDIQRIVEKELEAGDQITIYKREVTFSISQKTQLFPTALRVIYPNYTLDTYTSYLID